MRCVSLLPRFKFLKMDERRFGNGDAYYETNNKKNWLRE